jgi:hypothetical protein
MANLVNIVYYWRFARDRFHPLLNFVFPVIAILVQLAVIWMSVITELWGKGLQGRSAQGFIVAVSAIITIYVLYIKSKSSQQLASH